MARLFLQALLIKWTTPDPIRRRRRFARNTTALSRGFLKAFRITLRVNGRERLNALRGQSYLMIGNHVSYTDIIVLGSLEELVFITSVEMGNNPLLGDITRLGGCLFTDRRKAVSLPGEISRFAETVRQGFKVVLFPEGTSTDGSSIREFRKSLFQVAQEAQCTVLPVCVRYLRIDGNRLDASNRDLVCWYGDMDFASHFWKLLGHRLEVEVNVLPPLPYEPSLRRADLSDGVYSRMLACYHSYDNITQTAE
jgi:1-acyl-sn-glycerol-3-phosphate acyltransferase